MTESSVRTFPGMRDWIGQEERFRQWVTQRVRGVYESFGFEPLTTPAMEYKEILFGEDSETTRKIFAVGIRSRSQGNYTAIHQPLGLRYDHTVPLARVMAQHAANLILPYKRYAIGPVWRPEKPQKNRYREFVQVDFDTVGVAGLAADAETIAVLCYAAEAVGLVDFKAVFNHRVLLDGMAQSIGAQTPDQVTEVLRSWDKIGKKEFKSVGEELAGKGLDPGTVSKFFDSTEELTHLKGGNAEKIAFLRNRFTHPLAQRGLAEIEELIQLTSVYGGLSGRLEFSPYLARGFAYYTGSVFEMVTNSSEISFAGGGRFDHLIRDLGGPDLPATGASFGLERFVEVIREQSDSANNLTNTAVFVTTFNQTLEMVRESVSIAMELRRNGFATELYSGELSLGKQVAIADRKQIPIVVIAGPDEISVGLVTIKDLRVPFAKKNKTSNQVTCAKSSLIKTVAEVMGAKIT